MKLNLSEVISKVESAYPSLGETARLILAVAGSTRLEREQPVAVILIGGPSSGKTSLLMPLTRGAKDTPLELGVFRVDDFTPASLVSHAANKTAKDLEKIDLLPRFRGKCVVTKEMAPLFTGHEDELMKKFGVLASILDGEGYVSSSGSHGQRGYTDKIVFSLLGAVTPEVLSPKVYNCLSAVGPRFCFWEMPQRELDPNKWRGPSKDRKQIEADVTRTIVTFLNELFENVQEGSLAKDHFIMSRSSHEELSHIASLMALLRSKINYEYDENRSPYETSISQESPERAYRYLEQITLASALIDGRTEISDTDLKLALGIALGSATPSRRRMMRLFFNCSSPRSIQDLSINLRLSTDTASKYAEQLCRFGVLAKVNSDGTTLWDLKSPFRELKRLFGVESITHPQGNEPPQGLLDFSQFERT